MDEQPVALAINARSPNNWESNLRYGVSPQPAQAPENSNSGCKSCESLTELRLSRLESTSGRPRKNSQWRACVSRRGAWASMLMALWLVSLLLLAGHASTHNPHPVQSSGAAWSVYA